VGVKVNDEESDFFLTGKGLRQGDLIAPLLFSCVVDVFSRMLVKGTNCGLIRGLCPNFIPGGVVSLQYADDTLLFLENDPQVALNLKWILTCFKQISGMRINFHKSELIPINIESEELLPFIENFQCKEGSFPVKYLGIPLHFDRLKREDLQPLIESILRRITGCRGRLLSLAAKRILIQACQSSVPIYLLSFFQFPKWALSLLDTQLANFLWNDEEGNHKIHLANWPSVCMKKDFGGMGIPNL
jgi:DNA polymerase III psi subunit